MRTPGLNALYASYNADPNNRKAVDDLFAAVIRRAVNALQDEDEAQAFAIDVWRALPSLDIRVSFAGWVSVRLFWFAKHAIRRVNNQRTVAASYIAFRPDELGEQPTNDEKLAILAYRAESQLRTMDLPDVSAIKDEFIRKVSRLLQMGMTQAEVAAALGVAPATLRKRLQRYRDSVLPASLLAAA